MQKQRKEIRNEARRLLFPAWLLLITGVLTLIPGVILIVEGTTDAHFFLSILSVLMSGLQWLYALRFFLEYIDKRPRMKKFLQLLWDSLAWLGAFALALFFWGAILSHCTKLKADELSGLYIKIGSGYKLLETDHVLMQSGERIYFETGGKISARIEFGKETGNWTYGVSHHSQWFSGYPFNDRTETHVTELFVDYKWRL